MCSYCFGYSTGHEQLKMPQFSYTVWWVNFKGNLFSDISKKPSSLKINSWELP